MDLPDVDKADLSEQGDEEYCENCGRPMVLKQGLLRDLLRLHRLPGLQDHQADWRRAKEARPSWMKSARSAATTWCSRLAALASSQLAGITPPANTSSRKPSA